MIDDKGRLMLVLDEAKSVRRPTDEAPTVEMRQLKRHKVIIYSIDNLLFIRNMRLMTMIDQQWNDDENEEVKTKSMSFM